MDKILDIKTQHFSSSRPLFSSLSLHLHQRPTHEGESQESNLEDLSENLEWPFHLPSISQYLFPIICLSPSPFFPPNPWQLHCDELQQRQRFTANQGKINRRE